MLEQKKRNRWLPTLCAALLFSAAVSEAAMQPGRNLPDAVSPSSVGRVLSSSSAPCEMSSKEPETEEKRAAKFVPPVSSPVSSVASLPSQSQAPAAETAVKPANMRYYDVPLASDLQDLIFSECRSKNVSPDLVVALIGVESGYNPSMVSKTNDYGLMQINACHKEFFRKRLQITDLLDERQNIRAGVYMLSGIVGRYSDLNQALMVYNCGEAGAKRLWKQGVTSTAYSRKVIESVAGLKE